jgi:hypothetical protein
VTVTVTVTVTVAVAVADAGDSCSVRGSDRDSDRDRDSDPTSEQAARPRHGHLRVVPTGVHRTTDAQRAQTRVKSQGLRVRVKG